MGVVCFVFKLEKEYIFEWVVMGEGSEKSWGMKKYMVKMYCMDI